MNKKITLSIALVIMIIIIILAIIFLQPQTNQTTNTISAQEFSEQIETEINETGKKIMLNFKDLYDGDKVKLKDTIDYIKYREDSDCTSIEFDVNTTLASGDQIASMEFDFEGNITDTYQKNDQVEISFTIKHVEFTYDDWSYDLEVYEEAWDQDYYLDNYYTQLLPQTAIKK